MYKDKRFSDTAPGNMTDEATRPRQKTEWWDDLENDLSEFYEFRYNVVLGRAEFRSKAKRAAWRPLEDRDVYTILRKLRKERNTPKASKEKIIEIILSDFSASIDPLQEYFSRLPDAPGAISRYASCLTLKREEAERPLFEAMFRKWIIAAVANVFEEESCANHVCLIFTGGQGIGKSTALRAMVPDELQPYYYEGRFKPDSKDASFLLAEKFFINLDDSLAGINAEEIHELKEALTRAKVTERRVWDRFNTNAPRRASFAACSNEVTFLHDATGNRRFMPFELAAVDLEAAKSFPVAELWGEAFHAYKRGEVYWIAGEELAKLAEHNQDFEIQTPEYEAVVEHLQLPEAGGVPEYMTASKIKQWLEVNGCGKLSMKKLGEALRKAGFERKKRKADGKVIQQYHVVKVAPGIPSEPCDVAPLQDAGEEECPF